MAERAHKARAGLMGGLARVPKGFAKMSPEQQRAASQKGVAARQAKAKARREAEDQRRDRIMNEGGE
ncbi:hypothetical protein GCM10027080_05760 [Pedococcus soli]